MRAGGARLVDCTRCGRSHDEDDWERLERLEVLSPRAVGELLLHWPSDVCIEVRRCACGRHLAVRRR